LSSLESGPIDLHAEAGGLGDGEHSVEQFQGLDQQIVLRRLVRTLVAVGENRSVESVSLVLIPSARE
jgi:hypothetical protein